MPSLKSLNTSVKEKKKKKMGQLSKWSLVAINPLVLNINTNCTVAY